MKNTLTAALLIAGLATLGGQARAADLIIMTGGSMYEPLKAVGEDWTRSSGIPVTFVVGTTGEVNRKVRAGEHADIVVIAVTALKPLQTEGLVAPEAPAPLAKAIVGVAVKAGGKKPDISTVEAFRRAMLAAPHIVYPDPKAGATAGIYLAGLFDKMGIAPAISAKAVLEPNGEEVAAALAGGEADVGLTFVSELLPNKGVSVVGPLPDDIQNATPYGAAVGTKASDPKAARAFIAFATSAAERPRLAATGVAPLGN
jgi:molybdate transport system substrate-binding protein